MEATHVHYAYPRHTHDHYVICVVDRGMQSFTHKGTKYYTPPNGLILINPDIVHTGEPAIEQGFHIRSLYPSTKQLQSVFTELTGLDHGAPFFGAVRVDDPIATRHVVNLHMALKNEAELLACESHYLNTMAYLIERYADVSVSQRRIGQEHKAVQQSRDYIEANFARPIALAELARHVDLSTYYFLRVFRKTVGMPPHAYLQNVRIQHAQRLIEQGNSLADVAFDVGFNSQSHLTRRFKQFVGITPGEYAVQMGVRS